MSVGTEKFGTGPEIGLIPEIKEMRSYALDLWFDDIAVLTDEPRIRLALERSAEAGGATIIGKLFRIFPNGAVTGILILAQSHFSVHTWPELGVANVDLLGYGNLQGERILDTLEADLRPCRTNRVCLLRVM